MAGKKLSLHYQTITDNHGSFALMLILKKPNEEPTENMLYKYKTMAGNRK